MLHIYLLFNLFFDKVLYISTKINTPELLYIFVEPLDLNPVIYIAYCTYTLVNIAAKTYTTIDCP